MWEEELTACPVELLVIRQLKEAMADQLLSSTAPLSAKEAHWQELFRDDAIQGVGVDEDPDIQDWQP